MLYGYWSVLACLQTYGLASLDVMILLVLLFFFVVDFTLCGQALFVLWCRRMMCCVPYKILLLFCIAQLRQQCIIVGILCVVE